MNEICQCDRVPCICDLKQSHTDLLKRALKINETIAESNARIISTLTQSTIEK